MIEAGTVHPVAGPAIKNGVVLLNGDRIMAIGQQGNLQLPPNTKVFRFPEGHVYPGLIDAQTDAFTDASVQADGGMNGASKIVDGLTFRDAPADRLIRHGITTAYVAVRSPSQLRGQGAIVRPRKAGFDVWEEREQAALQLRMAQTQRGVHPLQRLQQLESVAKLFDGLDDYRDAQEKFDKDLEKYEKDFEKYLEHYRGKSGKKGGDKQPSDSSKGDKSSKDGKSKAAPTKTGSESKSEKADGKPPKKGGPPKKDSAIEALTVRDLTAEALAAGNTTADELTIAEIAELAHTIRVLSSPQDPRGRRRRPGGSAPQGKPAPKAGGDDKSAKSAKKDDGPKRPKYPKKPKVDPQKEALLKVLDGDMPLRVEVQRPEELRAALRLKREKDIPLMIVEQAYGAANLAKELAEQGAMAVLTDLLPHSLAPAGDDKNPMAAFDPTALPAKLEAAGVPFAIASRDADLSSMLPMMAAAAVGRGLTAEAALRAITLTPAEILGIAEDTGSLSRGKYADVLVTSGPLFASDSRVLLVLSKGQPEYEAR
ncbi:MAG: amidohydrolase family protein [Planctomycetota bacterium]